MAELTVAEAYTKFLRVKMIEGLAPRTLEDYRKNFKYLTEFIDGDIPLSELTVDKVRDYIYEMVYERELSNYTVNIRIRNVRTFLRFCYYEGYIPSNTYARIKLLKTDIDHIQPLTPKEFLLLVELIEKNRINFTRVRDKLILFILLDTMIRVSELVQIKVKNINLGDRTITLQPKGTKTRKYRIVPFTDVTGELLSEYLENRKFKEAETLLTNHVGEPMTTNSVQYKFREWGIKANIKGKRVSPHTIRHTGALFYIMNGGDGFSLQKILGHTSMEMVRRYVQMADDTVRVHHEKFSPINRISFDD